MGSKRARPPVAQLTCKPALAWRVQRHYLAGRAPRDRWLDVVKRICGLHAQLMSSAGIWRSERKGRSIELRIEPFRKLPRWATKAAEEEAERLASFLGRALDLRWETACQR